MGTRKNPHWPLARKGKKYGPNYLRYDRVCLWCGVTFPTSRPDAKTHSPKCRVALARYVAKHGQPPMFPFGLVRDPKRPRKKPAG